MQNQFSSQMCQLSNQNYQFSNHYINLVAMCVNLVAYIIYIIKSLTYIKRNKYSLKPFREMAREINKFFVPTSISSDSISSKYIHYPQIRQI